MGRDAHDGFTMFTAIGHALHSGHALSTALAARVSLFFHPVRPLPLTCAMSGRYSTPPPAPPIHWKPLWNGSNRDKTRRCLGLARVSTEIRCTAILAGRKWQMEMPHASLLLRRQERNQI